MRKTEHMLHQSATRCNTKQLTATHRSHTVCIYTYVICKTMNTALLMSRCIHSPNNTLQHTATHCISATHRTAALYMSTKKKLQRTATHCNTMQRCNMLQCVTVCDVVSCSVLQRFTVCCSVLRCVMVRCRVLLQVAACCSVLQRVPVYCSVLQCVVTCCSVLQCSVV